MAIASTIITGLTAKNSFPKNHGTKTGVIAINPAIIVNANANDIWKLFSTYDEISSYFPFEKASAIRGNITVERAEITVNAIRTILSESSKNAADSTDEIFANIILLRYT